MALQASKWDVQLKSDNSPLTRADQTANALICEELTVRAVVVTCSLVLLLYYFGMLLAHMHAPAPLASMLCAPYMSYGMVGTWPTSLHKIVHTLAWPTGLFAITAATLAH